MARLQIIELPSEQQEGTSGDGVVYRTPFVVMFDSVSETEDAFFTGHVERLAEDWRQVPFCRGIMVVPFGVELVGES